MRYEWEVSGKPGVSLLFSPVRAHLLTTAPKGQQWYLPLASRALCEADAAAAAASRQCHDFAKSLSLSASNTSLLTVGSLLFDLRKPATGSFAAERAITMRYSPFLFCERETEKERMR